jgi:hypothetical protein
MRVVYERHNQPIVSHDNMNTQQAIMPQVALQHCSLSSESLGTTTVTTAPQALAQQ